MLGRNLIRATSACLFLFFIAMPVIPALSAPLSDEKVAAYSRHILLGSPDEKEHALKELVERGSSDVAATMILAMRFNRDNPALVEAFQALTKSTADNWFDAMLWQERNADVVPHPSFRYLKIELFSRIDPEFLRFVGGPRSLPENMKIRLEEITWGGVRVDGIPSLDNPNLIQASDARYLQDNDLIFGVAINGDIRAYPLRIMGWHEMFNEVIGGVPVALAYCTLCGAGILFETDIEGQDTPLVFGSSGFLYRSNKLMFDRQTDSLWNQFTGEPINGPLVDSGIKLKIRPVVITSWAEWKKKHPQTKVLSLDTGHARDYASGAVYNSYFSSPDLMFPAVVSGQDKIKPKDYVFGIRDVGASKAWPVMAFRDGAVINDSIGERNVVLIGDTATRTVRAYDRGNLEFQKTENMAKIAGSGGIWDITEEFISSPEGQKLSRIAGHIVYWFAWDNYIGVKSDLYSSSDTKN